MEVWIGRDGERHGPYQEAEIRNWLRTGQVSPDDLAWYEGLRDWQSLRSLFPADALQQEAPPPLSAPLPAARPEALDLAGFWQRFAAWLLDYIVLIVPSLIAYYSMHADRVMQALVDLIKTSGSITAAEASPAFAGLMSQFQAFSAACVIIGFVYYTAMEGSRWQATLGKLAVGLKVTDLKGQRLNWRRAAVRNAVRLVNMVTPLIPLVFYIPVAWTRRHQGLHDMLASSLVVHGRASPATAATADDAGDLDL
ncbi:RDD family protein [Frateuria aurantia]